MTEFLRAPEMDARDTRPDIAGVPGAELPGIPEAVDITPQPENQESFAANTAQERAPGTEPTVTSSASGEANGAAAKLNESSKTESGHVHSAEKGHVCGANCGHNTQQAQQLGKQFGAKLAEKFKPAAGVKSKPAEANKPAESPHVHNGEKSNHACGPTCGHTKEQAKELGAKFGAKLAEKIQSSPDKAAGKPAAESKHVHSAEKGHVCNANCAHNKQQSNAQAAKFGEQLKSRMEAQKLEPTAARQKPERAAPTPHHKPQTHEHHASDNRHEYEQPHLPQRTEALHSQRTTTQEDIVAGTLRKEAHDRNIIANEATIDSSLEGVRASQRKTTEDAALVETFTVTDTENDPTHQTSHTVKTESAFNLAIGEEANVAAAAEQDRPTRSETAEATEYGSTPANVADAESAARGDEIQPHPVSLEGINFHPATLDTDIFEPITASVLSAELVSDMPRETKAEISSGYIAQFVPELAVMPETTQALAELVTTGDTEHVQEVRSLVSSIISHSRLVSPNEQAAIAINRQLAHELAQLAGVLGVDTQKLMETLGFDPRHPEITPAMLEMFARLYLLLRQQWNRREFTPQAQHTCASARFGLSADDDGQKTLRQQLGAIAALYELWSEPIETERFQRMVPA